MREKICRLIIPVLATAMLLGCVTARESGKKRHTAHMEFAKHGIIIEATYDPRLDNLIPGYKVLTVSVTNNSHDVIRLNPLRDRWEIVDAYGKKRKAINSLRIKDPRIFSQLPDQMKQMIDYPVGISVGYTETVDLFFPKHLELTSFRTVAFYSSDRKISYDMSTHLESPTHVKIPKGNDDGQANMDPRFRSNGIK